MRSAQERPGYSSGNAIGMARATLENRIMRVRRGEILTPLIDRYLSQQPEIKFSKETMRILTEIMLRPNRDRTNSYSASSLDTCMRRQMLQYLDYPTVRIPQAVQNSIFFNGNWLHLKWQGILLEMGLVVYQHGKPLLEVPVEIPELGVKGTIDAIIWLQERQWIWDLKGVNPGTFAKAKRGEVSRGYQWQLQIYGEATGLPSLLFYENKASQEYHEVAVEPSEDERKAAIARLRGLARYNSTRQLPPILPDFPSDRECRECPFQTDCKDAVFTDQYLKRRVA